MWNKPVMRFQGLLGFAVLAGVGLLVWCHLDGLVFEERPVRAKAEAKELARVIIDYHADTGQWPRNPDREIDLTLLLGRRSDRNTTATATTMAAGTPGSGFSSLAGADHPDDRLGVCRSWLAEIPLDPWGCPYRVMATNATIAVLSTGPNRKLDTDLTRLWSRPGNINPCDADDVGIILEIDQGGGF